MGFYEKAKLDKVIHKHEQIDIKGQDIAILMKVCHIFFSLDIGAVEGCSGRFQDVSISSITVPTVDLVLTPDPTPSLCEYRTATSYTRVPRSACAPPIKRRRTHRV
jgi:hypothetical protein